jgi:hypothetical protein
MAAACAKDDIARFAHPFTWNTNMSANRFNKYPEFCNGAAAQRMNRHRRTTRLHGPLQTAETCATHASVPPSKSIMAMDQARAGFRKMNDRSPMGADCTPRSTWAVSEPTDPEVAIGT